MMSRMGTIRMNISPSVLKIITNETVAACCVSAPQSTACAPGAAVVASAPLATSADCAASGATRVEVS